MAAVTVSPKSQGTGDGETAQAHRAARARGLRNHVRADHAHHAHWFIKRGFQPVDPEWLPEARKAKYNWSRKSQVLVKKL